MTPQELRKAAPSGATHYDFENGKPVFYKVNDMGYTMRSSGKQWILAMGLNINNYRAMQ